MNKLRKNIGKQFHLQYPQEKKKYLGMELTKGVNGSQGDLRTIEERD
jgi:hypothetical protein